jgi:hypothetical protein
MVGNKLNHKNKGFQYITKMDITNSYLLSKMMPVYLLKMNMRKTLATCHDNPFFLSKLIVFLVNES